MLQLSVCHVNLMTSFSHGNHSNHPGQHMIINFNQYGTVPTRSVAIDSQSGHCPSINHHSDVRNVAIDISPAHWLDHTCGQHILHSRMVAIDSKTGGRGSPVAIDMNACLQNIMNILELSQLTHKLRFMEYYAPSYDIVVHCMR